MDLIHGHQAPLKAPQGIVGQGKYRKGTYFSLESYSGMKRRPISGDSSGWQGKDNTWKTNWICPEGVFQEA